MNLPTTIEARHLSVDDSIIGDRLHSDGSISLGVTSVSIDGPVVIVTALSMSLIERTIAYATDEAVSVRKVVYAS